jgi:hypothetical protein
MRASVVFEETTTFSDGFLHLNLAKIVTVQTAQNITIITAAMVD